MRISVPYAALNAELHARRADYGSGGGKWAKEVEEIAGNLRCRTILDYGCGKGGLVASMSPRFDVAEYDPAIPGKDAPPVRADLVVCTDVLEHVEPDCLDDVLSDLVSLARRGLFFCIDTQPAKKSLPDGRNAHVCLHDAMWWHDTLAKFFDLDRFTIIKGKCYGLAVPDVREVQSFNTIPALDDERRNRNTRANVAKVKKRLSPCEPHGVQATLVCFGPSLGETWPEVAMDAAMGKQVFTVSGSHGFLVERGVLPYAHIDCDPRAYKSEQMGEAHSSVRYWLASCVDPAFVEKLAGNDVSLWHLWNGEASGEILDSIEPGSWALQGGACVGLRALALLYALGYREIDIHGMDCSVAEAATHAGKHVGKPQALMVVRRATRWFRTTGALASYCQQFQTLMENVKDVRFRLHGDGLLQHTMKTGARG